MLSSLWLFQGISVAVPPMSGGIRVLVPTTMQELHAAYMGMIAVVSFAGTAGYLVGATMHIPDGRLGRAVGRQRSLSLFRLGTLAGIGVVTTASALALVPLVRVPESPGWFVFTHLTAAWTFACLGYCVGLLLDRVSGILVMMLFPFVDVGIAQDYMLGPDLPDWAVALPSHPFAQLAVSSSFGEEIFDWTYVAAALLVLAVAVTLVYVVSGRRLRIARS